MPRWGNARQDMTVLSTSAYTADKHAGERQDAERCKSREQGSGSALSQQRGLRWVRQLSPCTSRLERRLCLSPLGQRGRLAWGEFSPALRGTEESWGSSRSRVLPGHGCWRQSTGCCGTSGCPWDTVRWPPGPRQHENIQCLHPPGKQSCM